jgi:hypothetical protein
MNSLATRSSFEKRSRATSTHWAGCSPNCILAIRVTPQTSPDVLAKALESEDRSLLVLTLEQNVVGRAICSSSRTWTSMTIIENVVAGAARSTGTTGSNRFARVIIAEAPLLHEFENIVREGRAPVSFATICLPSCSRRLAGLADLALVQHSATDGTNP